MGDQNTEILVSIIVPAYGVEQFIADSLNSIIGQTYRNIEIVLVQYSFVLSWRSP